MHRNHFEKNWHQLKKQIQAKWNKLTDADMDAIHGKFDQLIHKLQQKYGQSKEHIEKELENWMPEKQSQGMHGQEHREERKGYHESHEKKPYEKGQSQEEWKKKSSMGRLEHGEERKGQHEPHEKKPYEKGQSQDDWKKKRKAG